MTEIIIIGSERDCALERLIKDTLSETYRIVYIKGSSFRGLGKGYELIFFDCVSPVIDDTSASLIIAKKNAVLPDSLPAASTVIFNADDEKQLSAVRKSGAFAVDCGTAPTSTVSFSGKSEDTLMISLGRSLKALSGREIQPLEIPVRKHGADDYTLMSFTALRLLIDDFDSDLGELI